MSDESDANESDSNRKTCRIYCNTCRGTTRHALEFTHHGQDGDPSEEQYLAEWTDELWVCCGCETATLVNRWEMPGVEGIPGAPQPEVHCYPPRTHGKRSPGYFVKLPKPLSKLYKEIVESFNSGSMLLCTIGLRALLEGICKDKRITGRNLEKRIDGLSKIFPNQSLIDSLHGFRFAGNDAAHDLEGMYPSEASHAIDLMEDLLNFLYELDYKASRLKNAAKMARQRAGKHPAAGK